MSDEMNRIKQDLKTMEEAIGGGPELDRRYVWVGIGWGIWGIVFILFGLLPAAVPPYLLTAILIILLFALPHYLPRLACRDLPAEPPRQSRNQLHSNSGGLLMGAISLGIVFWVSRMKPAPPNMVFALVFLLGGAWALFTAWGRPWWKSLLAVAVSFGATGFAMPFLPKGWVGPAMGAAMIVGGFAGAAILHFQLKAYYANGKAAH
jgi:hypothetical protein